MTGIEKYLENDPQFTPAVVGFLVKDNKVLLGQRLKVSLGLGLNLIAGIGGKVGDEPGCEHESVEEALVREFQEEIKVTPVSWENMGRVRFIWTHKPKRNQDVSIFLIKEWTGDPQITEAIDPSWYDINVLPTTQMWEDNRDWVPKVLAGIIVDGVFLYGEEETVLEKNI